MRGLGDEYKRKASFNLYRKNADILVIQETHSCPEVENIWQNEWRGKIIFSHGTSSARGIAVLVSNEMYSKIRNIERDNDGRIIVFDLLESNKLVTFCAIYAPNKDSPDFLERSKVL